MSGGHEPKCCEVRTASDGTRVRVNGSIDQATLDRLTSEVRAMVDAECKAVSDFPMPAIAQKIHGRKAYWCRQSFGHDGPHGHAGLEWNDPPTCPSECLFINHPGMEHEAWVESREASS